MGIILTKPVCLIQSGSRLGLGVLSENSVPRERAYGLSGTKSALYGACSLGFFIVYILGDTTRLFRCMR